MAVSEDWRGAFIVEYRESANEEVLEVVAEEKGEGARVAG